MNCLCDLCIFRKNAWPQNSNKVLKILWHLAKYFKKYVFVLHLVGELFRSLEWLFQVIAPRNMTFSTAVKMVPFVIPFVRADLWAKLMKQERSFFLELIYQTKLAPSAGVNSNKEISLFFSRSLAWKKLRRNVCLPGHHLSRLCQPNQLEFITTWQGDRIGLIFAYILAHCFLWALFWKLRK
jgi:hypothetical protein